jgi:hypothetical protein
LVTTPKVGKKKRDECGSGGPVHSVLFVSTSTPNSGKWKSMMNRLLIVVLGNRNSGKSRTWNALFEGTVKTGTKMRRLYLNKAQWVDEVFLVSGSPEERDMPVEDLMPEELPRIVLCSAQYRAGVKDTFGYFFRHGYTVFVQWLNPGYSDQGSYADHLELREWLVDRGALFCRRSGQDEPVHRVGEIKQQILGWAKYRDLVCTEF